MNQTIERLIAKALPILGVVVAAVLLILGIIAISYLFIIFAVIGLVLIAVAFIRSKLSRFRRHASPSKTTSHKQNESLNQGRIIEHE